MLDFKLLNSQAFLNGDLIFRAFLTPKSKDLELQCLVTPKFKEDTKYLALFFKFYYFLHFFQTVI